MNKNLIVTSISFLTTTIIFFCFVTFAWIIIADPEIIGINLKTKDSNFEYQYYHDFDVDPVQRKDGNLDLELAWAIPGKLYRITIKIVNKEYNPDELITYHLSLGNISAALYDYETDTYLEDTEASVYSFYKLIVEETKDEFNNSNLNTLIFQNEFDYSEYKDGLNNIQFENDFENKTYKMASFYNITGEVGQFKEDISTLENNQTTTSIVIFILARDDAGNDNMFQESQYEGKLVVNVNRKKED